LPLVSSNIPEVVKVGLCKIAQSPKDFPKKVAECLAEGGGCTRERAEKIRSESWESRVADIRRHVGEVTLRRGLAL
jgi:hypothetical protein